MYLCVGGFFLYFFCVLPLPHFNFLARFRTAHAYILYSTEEAFFMLSEQDNDDGYEKAFRIAQPT